MVKVRGSRWSNGQDSQDQMVNILKMVKNLVSKMWCSEGPFINVLFLQYLWPRVFPESSHNTLFILGKVLIVKCGNIRLERIFHAHI